MALSFGALTRPNAGTDVRVQSRHRTIGLSLAAVGLVFATVSFINSVAAGDLARQGGSADLIASLGAWSFGLTTAAFGTVKLAIGLILLGIVRHIWVRVESIKTSLPGLIRAHGAGTDAAGELESDFGPATATSVAPKPLLIHRLAGLMWAPMLAMGAMLVYAGLLLSIAAAGNVAADPALASSQRAWVQGVQFLGEGLLLSGISFLLGTILGAIRAGGGEVQESLGLTVKTLRMPATAQAFIALMMLGLMVEIAQFAGYVYISSVPGSADYAAFATWLGPLREFGLGALLSGIVLALATIARSLGFQFARITQIITSGR
ncbi:MAG: hypothetical protein L0221_04650 [Chloroflexi bacterium]|nr:hypothetical protein [Chloroflexota bacterium]